MVTKEDMSDEINKILGTEDDPIDFTKMNKEDLDKLLKVLNNPAKLIQIGIRNLRQKAKKEILEKPLKEILERPLIEEVMSSDRGGILGLGILNRILGSRESE